MLHVQAPAVVSSFSKHSRRHDFSFNQKLMRNWFLKLLKTQSAISVQTPIRWGVVLTQLKLPNTEGKVWVMWRIYNSFPGWNRVLSPSAARAKTHRLFAQNRVSNQKGTQSPYKLIGALYDQGTGQRQKSRRDTEAKNKQRPCFVLCKMYVMVSQDNWATWC